MADFKLPDVGEGLTEAEIVSWRVAVGDVVAVNDVIVEIETAKSLVELPSPYAGTVGELLVAEGETVAVGTPIIRIGEPVTEPGIDLSNPAASGGGEGESLVGRNKAEGATTRRARRVVDVEVRLAPAVSDVRVLAKPPVRKRAKDLGIDLASVAATGPNGTVTRADLEQTPPRDGGEIRETREPIKGVRKAMGQAMVDSAFSAPHVTEWVTVDVTRTTELVERLRGRRELRDLPVSPLLLLVRAVCLAVRRTPIVNSLWDDAAQEVVTRSYVNLGIAAATPRGLVVPNIKDADAMSLVELATALGDLVATARSGRTAPADMAGGTLTITNVGPFGVDAGTPIINPGESAIVCLGAIGRRPWVVVDEHGQESLGIRDVCTLALSFDHRHIDGESGSRFLADVAAIMSDPGTALLF